MFSSLFGFRAFCADTKPDTKVLFHPYLPEADFWTGLFPMARHPKQWGIGAANPAVNTMGVRAHDRDLIFTTAFPEVFVLAFLFCTDGHHGIEPRCAPGWNHTCATGSEQQQRNDEQEYSRIKRAYAIQHGANESRRRDAAGYPESESK